MDTTAINSDHFPEPYNREIPHAIEVSYQRMSPEGIEVLEALVERAIQNPNLNPEIGLDEAREAAGEYDGNTMSIRVLLLWHTGCHRYRSGMLGQ